MSAYVPIRIDDDTVDIRTTEAIEVTTFGQSILDDADEATFKATVNLEIGIDVQAYDATLTSIALLGTAADKLAYTTNVDTWAETGLTAFGRSIIDDADEATFKATVNLEIGTDVQAYDATLTSLALLGTAADKLAYTTNVDTWAETGLTAFGRSIIDDADEATFKATVNLEIGTDVQAYDATLTSLALLGTAADKLAYTTNVDTWAETGLTAFGRSIIDDADEATFKATVNLEIGTDVQAYDAGLADIAALAVTDGNVIVGDGANWVAESGATARTSLGLGTADTATFGGLSVAADTDAVATIGRGKIGYDGTNSDVFSISHYDRMSSSAYSITMYSTGSMSLNTSTAGAIYFRINNATTAGMRFIGSTNNFLIYASTEPATASRLVVKGSTADGSTDIYCGQDSDGNEMFAVNTDGKITAEGSNYVPVSSGTTGGSGSGGAGNQYVELSINGTVYKMLHDGTV
jgi:hypothetical protein